MCMFFSIFAVDDNVVDVDETAHTDNSMQDSVHSSLDNCWGVF